MKRLSAIFVGVLTDSAFWFCVAVLSGWLFFGGFVHHAKETVRCEERGRLLADTPWRYENGVCVMHPPQMRDTPVNRVVRGVN